jgi:hypothetical protein
MSGFEVEGWNSLGSRPRHDIGLDILLARAQDNSGDGRNIGVVASLREHDMV